MTIRIPLGRAYQNREPRGGPIPPGSRDAGPPHKGLLCLGPTGDWLCRYPAGDAHSVHAPYVEGEYLTEARAITGRWL